MRPASEAYVATISRLAEFQSERVRAVTQQVMDEARRTQLQMLAIAIACLGLGVAAAWLITRSVVAPLREAIHAAEGVGQGDLAREIHSSGSDETAQLNQALSQMQHSLRHLVGSVRENANGVATASSEISLGSNDLSARTEQQASALQQTAASMEQLGGSLGKLNKSLVAAEDQNGATAEAFAALGVKTRDAQGNIRATDDVLLDIAASFAGAEDNATKTAIAMQLFERIDDMLAVPKIRRPKGSVHTTDQIVGQHAIPGKGGLGKAMQQQHTRAAA